MSHPFSAPSEDTARTHDGVGPGVVTSTLPSTLDGPGTVPETPSGRQYVITHGDQRATVTQVGATLREYTVREAAVVDGFGVGDRASDGRGQ